jgi:hypothetical protein
MAIQKAKKEAMATGFKFVKAGDTLKGYYQGQTKKIINGTPAVEHRYKTSTGLVSVLGQANILKQIENNGIVPGTYVEVQFTGETQKLKNGRTMKVYDIVFDLDDNDLSAAPTSGDEDWVDSSEELEETEETPPPRPASNTSARVQALLNKGKSARPNA